MFKDLLVITTGEGDDAAALATAIALAQEHAAHLAVLVQVRYQMPVADTGAMGIYPIGDYAGMFESARRQGAADCAHWKQALRAAGVEGEVRLEQDFPWSPADTAAVHARYSDVALLGLDAPGALRAAVHEQFAKCLLASGRPVLAVPRGWTPRPLRRALIGWRPGAPATRAVNDALPMLVQAGEVDILCIDPHRALDGHGDEPGADLAAHLARHAVRATVHCASADGRDPGEVLLQRARELGADLLVAGGYGHSRFQEWVLGGTTRYLLQQACLPVWFSH
jgi:nucleotide-binding universal stress UspA family protein